MNLQISVSNTMHDVTTIIWIQLSECRT